MFPESVYKTRRSQLKSNFDGGILLFLGNPESPRNFLANVYPFRQDSTFLYYWGLDKPDLVAVIDVDDDQEIIFGNDPSIDEIVWTGPLPSLAEKAEMVGVSRVGSLAELESFLSGALQQKRDIHFLPQYRSENKLKIKHFLNFEPEQVNEKASVSFIKAVVEQRSCKSDEEIAEIEKALEITRELHLLAMQKTRPGIYERDVVADLEGGAFARGVQMSFAPIFSIRGEVLHNPHYHNKMKTGDMVVCDMGVESTLYYASDITRTIPVSGKFTEQQRDIYQIVLEAQKQALTAIKPGVKFKDVHLLASKVLATGLKQLGLMQGDVDEAVANGAHALFFQCGLGHMMGLDVHDMEALGEDYVGYDEQVQRSKQFGLCYLRLGKAVQPGFVITVEPGLYFIPVLIDHWRAGKKFEPFICYDEVEKFKHFGGIRIEDNVLVTDTGARVLGEPLAKEISEVEEVCSL